MTKLELQVGRELFRFSSKEHWINKAKGWFERAREVHRIGHEDFVCVDTRGRLCRYGRHFSRAEREDTFPIIVYAADAAAAEGAPQ